MPSGQLTYIFTDDRPHRNHTVDAPDAERDLLHPRPYPTDADFALSGNWYGGAATSGQGFTAEVNPTSGAFFGLVHVRAERRRRRRRRSTLVYRARHLHAGPAFDPGGDLGDHGR